MGVFHKRRYSVSDGFCLPHVRGGVSFTPTTGICLPESSPRAWGCFLQKTLAKKGKKVFPTCVGVFPAISSPLLLTRSLPHVRGGVSVANSQAAAWSRSSPRAWGCFLLLIFGYKKKPVFPTCVGVFQTVSRKARKSICLPHVRGGVSRPWRPSASAGRSSPRAWGCFLLLIFGYKKSHVFPTCVGVFLTRFQKIRKALSLPHVRGGVSIRGELEDYFEGSSPRAWGCFFISGRTKPGGPVFPTCVGVFLHHNNPALKKTRLPHVRGGVSLRSSLLSRSGWSSPRAWGCFDRGRLLHQKVAVFPTCVGVFLYGTRRRTTTPGLPHVRGGVSLPPDPRAGSMPSSPRAWGCFRLRILLWRRSRVFPTCVGVFPSSFSHRDCCIGLPHVRGGVSRYFLRLRKGKLSSPRAWGCFSW